MSYQGVMAIQGRQGFFNKQWGFIENEPLSSNVIVPCIAVGLKKGK